ncbi:hypothetical protein COB52_03140 [Candidatus Kaiserbacteria bacterium]|nr:MAG: hypothetical protein COB52_03140 [Candidatus Kaiserbacteria bacterium]
MRTFLYLGLFFVLFPILSHAQTATLLWETQTYTPPFYKGASLYSDGGTIYAEVYVSNSSYSKESMSYKWIKDGVVLGSLSGVGKSSLITSGPRFLGDYILEVKVSDPEGIEFTSSALLIETKDPKIVFYETDPLLGSLFHRSIKSNGDFPNSSQIQAIPYFLSTQSIHSELLSYSWNLNGKSVAGVGNTPSFLSMRVEGEDSSVLNVSLSVAHSQNFLQDARGRLNLTIEGNSRRSLFGL